MGMKSDDRQTGVKWSTDLEGGHGFINHLDFWSEPDCWLKRSLAQIFQLNDEAMRLMGCCDGSWGRYWFSWRFSTAYGYEMEVQTGVKRSTGLEGGHGLSRTWTVGCWIWSEPSEPGC